MTVKRDPKLVSPKRQSWFDNPTVPSVGVHKTVVLDDDKGCYMCHRNDFRLINGNHRACNTCHPEPGTPLEAWGHIGKRFVIHIVNNELHHATQIIGGIGESKEVMDQQEFYQRFGGVRADHRPGRGTARRKR